MPANKAGTKMRGLADDRLMGVLATSKAGIGGGATAMAVPATRVVNEVLHWGQRSFLLAGTGRDERSAA